MTAARSLVDAVAGSIRAEVGGALTWNEDLFDPLWRNPMKGKTLNVYPSRRSPATQLWTGVQHDALEIVVEYGEPAADQAMTLNRDPAAELAAHDVADALRSWALAHEDGFAPSWFMAWTGTDYVPSVRRELFSRYCRITIAFNVVEETP